MTPSAQRYQPTAGALRAARAIQGNASLLQLLPELIDRETGVREILEILENIIDEAGDLIESRSPELVAAARSALRRYSDETPRQAE
jgi:flagellar biosynthesis component FlhA